jgi:hypothetical protein
MGVKRSLLSIALLATLIFAGCKHGGGHAGGSVVGAIHTSPKDSPADAGSMYVHGP